jgi:hypothetical protein
MVATSSILMAPREMQRAVNGAEFVEAVGDADAQPA